MRKIFFYALALLVCQSIVAQNNIRVLFIGNSYTEVNNLPSLVQQVALSTGDTVTYQSNTPGGCTFNQHCSNTSMDYIKQGAWDFVVLQEQSQYPAFPISQVQNECFPYAAQLVDSVVSYNTCGEPVFYMTWGRKNGDTQNATAFPPIGTYNGMDSMLYERYMTMKNDNNASVSPVGRVWHYIRDHYPSIELYSSDESHPSMAGSYAAACSFYAVLLHKNPMLINYNPSLDTNTASIIRNVAKIVVFDSLSKWLRANPPSITNPPLASFDTCINNASISLTNTSQNADHYIWYFGDGASAYTFNTSHTFATSGNYNIELIASRCHVEDTAIMQIAITNPLSLYDANTEIKIYPNPTGNILNINNIHNIKAISLITINGKVLYTNSQPNASENINISKFEKGVYVLNFVSIDDKEYNKLIIKQ